MILEMKVPSPGESIKEVEIATWLVKDGDYVEKDQAIAEVDSDKATLELPAEMSGIITLKAEEGDTVAVGAVVCLIDTDAVKPEGGVTAPATEAPKAEVKKRMRQQLLYKKLPMQRVQLLLQQKILAEKTFSLLMLLEQVKEAESQLKMPLMLCLLWELLQEVLVVLNEQNFLCCAEKWQNV